MMRGLMRLTTSSSDVRKAIEPDQSLFKFSLFSLVGSVAAIAIATAILYMLVINGSNKQLTATFFQAHAENYASYFDQKLEHLQQQLAHVAQNPELLTQLGAQNSDAIERAEKLITRYVPDLIKVKLLPYNLASLNREYHQLSFREVDMVNRAEQGERVAAEAHSHAGETVIRLVQAVDSIRNDEVAGVLLATFRLNALQRQFSDYDPNNGSLRLEQLFRGGDPQTLIHLGPAFNNTQPLLTLPLSTPHWRVLFQPSESLAQSNSLSELYFWLPIAFVLIAVSLSILCAYIQLRKHVRSDAITLTNYCRGLINDEQQKPPAFSLSLFHSMAKALSNRAFDRALENETATPSKREPPPESMVRPDQVVVDELLEAELEDEDILDLDLATLTETEQTAPASPTKPAATDQATAGLPTRDISPDIFRAYDIRGIVDHTLDTDIAYRIGQAVGTEAQEQGNDSVVVGADGRLSSPELCAALVRGLRDSGADVVNLGTVPTPLVYYATHQSNAKSGIMITGSHNPPEYNGFKIVIDGNTLAGDEIQALRRRIAQSEFKSGSGSLDNVDVVNHYIEQVSNDIVVAKPLKVVLDCGNGVAGEMAPRLLEALGCEVIPLYCEIDGRFPNHHPDPGKPENLQDLIATVAEHQADIGLALDGDGDRLGVVTNKGHIIWPDRLMMLFAKDIASRNPGADIIYDVKCSRRLADIITRYGGRPIMWKTGHSLIKAKMRETGALLAGEMSGHIFFKERWLGFDDGIYSAARLLEILGQEQSDADTLFDTFPDDVSTPEINIEVTEKNKFDIVSRLQQQADFAGAEMITIDGVRANFQHGWGLVRASNTTPVLVLRFGADDEQALQQIQGQFKKELLAVAPELQVPF